MCTSRGLWKVSRALGSGRDVSFQWVSACSVPRKLISQGTRSEKLQLKRVAQNPSEAAQTPSGFQSLRNSKEGRNGSPLGGVDGWSLVFGPPGQIRSKLDVVRRQRSGHYPYQEGAALRYRNNPPSSRELSATVVSWWGFPFWGQSGPSYLGDREEEKGLMHQGRLGLGTLVCSL